jgi:hypothetical protein
VSDDEAADQDCSPRMPLYNRVADMQYSRISALLLIYQLTLILLLARLVEVAWVAKVAATSSSKGKEATRVHKTCNTTLDK